MKKEVYDSVISKLVTIVPLFANSIINSALKKVGETVESITPIEFKKMVEEEIDPRLKKFIGEGSSIFTACPGVIEVDEQDNITYINDFLSKILFKSFYNEEDNKRHFYKKCIDLKILKQIGQMGGPEVKELYVEEIKRHLNVAMVPFYDKTGHKIGAVFLIQDISTRIAIDKEADLFSQKLSVLAEELRKKGEYLEKLFDSSVVGIATVNKEGQWTFVNETAASLVGYTPEELCQKKIQDITWHEDINKSKEKFQKLIGGEIEHYEIEKRYVRKDGSIFWARLFVSPLYDKNNEIERILGIFIDIDESKCVEQEKEKMQKQLFQSSKLASIGELAAGVAHEINNPLAIIHGYSMVLQRKLKEAGFKEEEYFEPLDVLFKSVKRITNIINGLRSYAHVGDDNLEIINIHELLENTVGLIRNLYENKNIEIETELSAQQTTVLGISGKIQQVFMNYLSNAKDAIGKKSNGKIEIKSQNVKDWVVISVIDNGHGIKPADKEKIFDPFYTTKPPGKGTGLGMNIVHSIINKMGGKIEVDSNYGQGTSFTTYFPISRKKVIHKSQLIKNKEVEFKKFTGNALIVDDEKEVLKLLTNIIIDFGFEVDVAADGQEALEKIRSKKFDLVITDLKMPKMSGERLIDAIKKERHLQDTKIIVITGSLLTEYSEQDRLIITNYSKGIIKKPFCEEEIYNVLKDIFTPINQR